MFEEDMVVRIIGLYRDNPMNVMSINEISTRLGKKYPFVHKKTKEMVEKNLLQLSPIGRSHLCSLNLSNTYTRYLLGLAELLHKEKKEETTERSVLSRTIFDSLGFLDDKYFVDFIITSETEDVFIIVRDKEIIVRDKEHLNNLSKEKGTEKIILKNNPKDNNFEKIKYNITILTSDEFKEILLNSEIFEKHTVIYGFEQYISYIYKKSTDLQRKYNPLIKGLI